MNWLVNRNAYYTLLLSLFWLLSPFTSVMIIIFFVGQYSVNRSQLRYLCLLISLSFALLAYTQKSASTGIETDISRYYAEFYHFIDGSLVEGLLRLWDTDVILTYSFTFINILFVSVFKNVQVISLFWVALCYYLHFLSVFRMMELLGVAYSRTNIFLLLIFSLFGAILFTQVTETIKNAVAFSLFFYLFSVILTRGSFWKVIVLLLIGVGIHSSILMLLPIFLYKKFSFNCLFVVSILCILICPFVNLMQMALFVLPDCGFAGELAAKAEDYASDNASSSSIRYITIGLFLLIYAAFLYVKDKSMAPYLNIALIYIIMMFLNFNNSNAFIRFANFSQFIIVLECMMLLLKRKRLKVYLSVFMFFFFLTNLQMTYGRTLSGGYCSSYMDNSVVKILISNVYDYLTYKAYP